ncbi:hypothetical protein Tco_0038592 [Tanacetum coccineum]
MEVNEIRAERIAKNANPLAIVATAQPHQDPYYQASKHKVKEIAKPITPPSKSASEEDSDPEQAQKDKEMQKILALIAKECEQELEAHYSYMAKIQEVPTADSGTDSEPLEQNSKESNSIQDSCLVALQNKQTKLERYKNLNDRTVDYEKHEHKLNETLGLLAQKDTDIKEGLKLKAYEISVVKEKHDELVKQNLLTKSHYEGLVKEKTKELVNQAWVKHSKDHFRAPTTHDMEILIKTCLMPLALKTQNDSFAFVHKLKQEMHADLKYVESLEKEIDELESDKAEFSNICAH